MTGAPNNPVSHFGAPWRPFGISRPLIGRNTECSDQKTYLAKVDQGTHITIEKWSRFFDLGGFKTCLPSPEGGRQTKSCSNQKTYFAKVVRPYYYTEVISFFFIWGVQDLFAFPRREKANEKSFGWKNLFNGSWLERLSYCREVTSVFDLGSVSLPQRLCRRCSVAGSEYSPIIMSKNKKLALQNWFHSFFG